MIPLTSVITTVTYGTDEKAVLYYQNSGLFMDIPLSELSAHITERGNPGNAKRVRIAEVQLPADILRNGFHLIDTPGLGSSIVENTRTTEAFLAEADAFILVTSYDSPLSLEEITTLQTIQTSGRHCFLVLNKQDGVTEVERAEALAHVSAQMSDVFCGHPPPILSVSARDGLAARLAGNAEAIVASGLAGLEAALVSFMMNDKRRAFLLGMCDRIEQIACTTAAQSSAVAKLDSLRAAMDGSVGGAPGAFVPNTVAGLSSLPDCAVCQDVSQAVFSHLAGFQSQLTDDLELRKRHAASGGLCAPHSVQFERLAAPREVCTGFAPVLERQAARLRAAAAAGASSRLCQAVTDALPDATSCPACHVATQAACQALDSIAARAATSPDAPESILCLPHLAGLMALLPRPTAEAVLQSQSGILERLAADMKRFALKQDGAKRHLASREELTAGRRGLRALLGDPSAATGPRRCSAPVQ